MTHLNSEHLSLLNTLLSRTEEFIEFFDRAETKMSTWRHEIAQQAHYQQDKLNDLKNEIDRIASLMNQTDLDNFLIATEGETTSQNDEYLDNLKHTEQQLLRQIHGHRAELTRITQHAMTQITQTTTQAVSMIEEQLSTHFASSTPQVMPLPTQPPIDHLDDITTDTIQQHNISRSKPREWRSIGLTLVTTIMTAVIFGMYSSDEYPWEIHQQAMSERGAGKVLINAWPSLTHEEKNKILYRAT